MMKLQNNIIPKLKRNAFLLPIGLCFFQNMAQAQHHLTEMVQEPITHADSVRGNINAPERTWWDVLKYDIIVKVDDDAQTIKGSNKITYKVVKDSYPAFMQIDLQEPMEIDSVIFGESRKLNFTRDGNAFHINVPKQKYLGTGSIEVFFHGKPKKAVKAPWDGGWVWAKDSLNRPWITVACQGLGASAWYPCKDVQDDEPNQGASLSVITKKDLVEVGNGRLKSETTYGNEWKEYTWEVKNPINNYTIVPYIGYYVPINATYAGLKGKLDVTLWALDYNKTRAQQHSLPEVMRMLKAFEYWFGPYPFYEDGYQLVDAPHLGMEHQSAVAYGNHYLNGYLGRDLSGTGQGDKFDFIIVHESGHEWFANNITSKDIADMWIHESFTNYSETLFTEYYYGKEAGQEYCYGIRKNIVNDKPIIGPYNVNREGSGDMYYKGANMINSIRSAIGDDKLFREILIGMNKDFYHSTVTSTDIENYINKKSGKDFTSTFQQYLTTTQIPQLEYAFSKEKNKFYFRYVNCLDSFNMPLTLISKKASLKVIPSTKWQSISISNGQLEMLNPTNIEFQYYISTKKVAEPEN
ncbi:M1 family metallopeptidase [Rhizosphaericola mali]|nr:M1 family metallopeptidase [Rhizosphaericola mali]